MLLAYDENEDGEMEREEPIIFDTTLREGFQTPGGIGASLEERIAIAGHVKNYAHWVELGMPANNVDFRIIEAIRDRYLQEEDAPGIAVLLRLHDRDVERGAEVISPYANNMVHSFLGISEEHRNNRFNGEPSKQDYIDLIREFARKIAERPEFSRVMFSPEDFFRAWQQDDVFVFDVLAAASEGYDEGNKMVGRNEYPIFNLPDTTGGSTVLQFDEALINAQHRFPWTEFSVHCHNDVQTANGQAWDVYERRGVRFIQTTFGDTGERNGIARTDIAIKVFERNGWLTNPRIINEENLQLLDPTTITICGLLGREPPEDLYRCNVSTAGIHTDIARRDAKTYHIFDTRYGSRPILEVGPTSGSKQVMDVLDANNILYSTQSMETFADALKEEANRRKAPISETHICYEAQKFFNERDTESMLKVTGYRTEINHEGDTVLYMRGTIGSKKFSKSKENGGSVEAAIDLLNDVVAEAGQVPVELERYADKQIPRIDPGYLEWKPGNRPGLLEGIRKNAYQVVSVTLNDGNKDYHGWMKHDNIVVSAIGAVVNAFEEMYALRAWQK